MSDRVLDEQYLNERVGLVEDCLRSVNGVVTGGRVISRAAYFNIEVDRDLLVDEARRLRAVLGVHLCALCVRGQSSPGSSPVADRGVHGVAMPEVRPRGSWSPGPEWMRRDQVRFAAGTALPLDFQTWEKREPVRDASVQSDVQVPLLQAAICGVIGVVFGWSVGLLLRVGPVWMLWGPAVGSAVFGVAWWLLLLDHRRLLWRVERITNRDLDGDGVAGEPVRAAPDVVRVEVVEKRPSGGATIRYLDLPFPDQLPAIAAGVLNGGVSFSRDGLSPWLSQGDYARLSDVMLQRGLLVEAANKKRSLTRLGEIVFRQFAAGASQESQE